MITFKVDSHKLRKVLGDLKGRLRNPQGAMQIVGIEGVKEVRRNFELQRDVTRRPWKPLHPVTLKLRRRGSSQPLMDTGQLRNSIRHQQVGGATVKIFTRRPFAGVHQEGMTIRKRGPGRFMIPVKGGQVGRRAIKAGKQPTIRRRTPAMKAGGEAMVILGSVVRIPKRQFMYLSGMARKRIAGKVARWIQTGQGA